MVSLRKFIRSTNGVRKENYQVPQWFLYGNISGPHDVPMEMYQVPMVSLWKHIIEDQPAYFNDNVNELVKVVNDVDPLLRTCPHTHFTKV